MGIGNILAGVIRTANETASSTRTMMNATKTETETFTVIDSLESKDGASGWDVDKYGPFTTEADAEAFARRLASEGYASLDEDHRLVEVSSDGGNYGGDPCHVLYSWRSDDDNEDTVHTLGPTDEEKEALLIADEEEEADVN